jgi:carbamate kinase
VSTIVVALGGNALARRGEPITAAVQQRNIETAVNALAPLFDAGHRVVLTHGNGPQVGVLLLETEADTAAGPYRLHAGAGASPTGAEPIGGDPTHPDRGA